MSSPCASSILRADVALEARRHLRDLTFRRRRHAAGRHVEEDEVVVVGEAHHHARRAEIVVVEEIAHRARRRLEHGVELLPAVDLLDLRVAHEVEVEHDELTALLEQLARALDGDGQRGQPGERIVEHLLVLDPIDTLRHRRAERRHRAPPRTRSGRRSPSASPGSWYHSSALSSTARRRAVSSAQPTSTGTPRACASSMLERSSDGSLGGEQQRAHAGLAERRSELQQGARSARQPSSRRHRVAHRRRRRYRSGGSTRSRASRGEHVVNPCYEAARIWARFRCTVLASVGRSKGFST